jgi:hypothetical protein
LLRPDERVFGARSDLSGLTGETSSNPEVVMNRRLGVMGLYFFTGIFLP